MLLFFALIRFVALASAYQVTSPNRAAGWSTANPNVVTWQRVSTDPLNFTLVLSNQAQTSSYQQVLAALVDGTFGNVTVAPPSMGYPTGNGFRVKFVRDTEHLSTIYAQSGRFSIEQATTTTTSTSVNIDKHNLMIQVKQIRQEGGGHREEDYPDFGDPDEDDPFEDDPPDFGDPPDYDPPDYDSNNADRITAAGSAGLIFGALAAIVL